MGLLLTRLEVEARRGPPSSRRHPRQRKPYCTQLLLNFPPAAEKLDEWRATVRCLVGIANMLGNVAEIKKIYASPRSIYGVY